jgi:hypothetical protein
MTTDATGTTPATTQDTSAGSQATTLLDGDTTGTTAPAGTTTTTGDTTTTATSTPATTTNNDKAPDGWGEKWRETYANGDAKLQARLERYASPKAVVDALLEAQKRISAGEIRKPLAADAPPEAVAQWREDNGVPQKPEGYFEKLPEGLVLGDEDKEIFGDFATRMHEKHVPTETMHEVVRWYNEFVDNQAAQRAEIDRTSLDDTINVLRDEWGADYRTNVNVMKSYVAPVEDLLGAARLADGTPLMNNPRLVSWLTQQAREINPVVTLVPNHQNPTQGIDQEIAAIEKVMRTDRRAYDRDDKMQARYRQLLEGREKLAKAS